VKKQFIVLSVILLFGMLLSSCGNINSGSNASSTQSQDQNIKIRIAWWGSQMRHDITNQVLEMYSDINPNISFEAEYSSYDQYYPKLSAQAAAGTMPDVFQCYVGVADTNMLIDENYLANLDDLIDKDILDLSQWDESSKSLGKWEGITYGISLGTNGNCMLYDPALFVQAGVSVPVNGVYTWDDLETTLEALKAGLPPDIWPMSDFGTGGTNVDGFLAIYLRQNGTDLFTPDNKHILFDEKVLADFFAIKKRFIDKGLVPPPGMFPSDLAVEESPLVKGNAVIMSMWSNICNAYANAADRPMEILGLPGPNIEKAIYLRPSQHLAIAENSKIKEAAARFVAYFVNDIEANKVLNAERGIPNNPVVRAALTENFNDIGKKVAVYTDYVAQNSIERLYTQPVKVSEISRLLSDIEEEVEYGKTAPEAAAAAFVQGANAILDE